MEVDCIITLFVSGPDHCLFIYMYFVVLNKNKKWLPLRAMKTFIRKKMGNTT